MLNRDSRHCWPVEACAKCGGKLRHEQHLRMCPKRDRSAKPVQLTRRPRTDEEIKATNAICRACPHYLSEPTETLDAGVCLIRAKGCGACKSLEQFAKYIADGKPCPDGRFDGTPLVE